MVFSTVVGKTINSVVSTVVVSPSLSCVCVLCCLFLYSFYVNTCIVSVKGKTVAWVVYSFINVTQLGVVCDSLLSVFGDQSTDRVFRFSWDGFTPSFHSPRCQSICHARAGFQQETAHILKWCLFGNTTINQRYFVGVTFHLLRLSCIDNNCFACRHFFCFLRNLTQLYLLGIQPAYFCSLQMNGRPAKTSRAHQMVNKVTIDLTVMSNFDIHRLALFHVSCNSCILSDIVDEKLKYELLSSHSSHHSSL